MRSPESIAGPVSLHVSNIGGIADAQLDIQPGVTILEGRNATNRTSFLQAIMGGLGSNDLSLKGDTDEGEVEMAIEGETFDRKLRRTNGTVTITGDPYLHDPTLAELFAFLLERNEARRAVARGDDLRDLIMQPVDTDEIQAEIDRLERERDKVEEELAELDSLKDELPSLEQQRTRLQDEIEGKRETLAEKEAEIEERDTDISETREEKRELETKLEELRDLRSELEATRNDIERQEKSIASLRQERSELQDEQRELPETPAGEVREIEQELSRYRDRKQTKEAEVSSLQNIIQFNEDMLDSDETAVSDVLASTEDVYEDLTDQLVTDESVVCWTCGSEVNPEQIDETLEELRSVRANSLDDVREIESEIEELQDRKRKLERQQRRRETIKQKLADIEDEIENRSSQLEELRDQRDQLNDDIEAVEKEVAELESEDFSEILDLHKEANQIEFELGQIESDLDDITDRIATIEDRISEEDDLTQQLEQLQEELEAQGSRIDRIEREAIDAFNEHMEEILSILDYKNLARIWIERKHERVREGRQKVEQTTFDLHVVRTTDSGATYEDTIDHLSESEREVTGLVFALAGYLVHDVHESVPFMLLDSLEAIDSERLAVLVDYFADFADYLVAALLPEDAQALSDEYHYVTEI